MQLGAIGQDTGQDLSMLGFPQARVQPPGGTEVICVQRTACILTLSGRGGSGAALSPALTGGCN